MNVEGVVQHLIAAPLWLQAPIVIVVAVAVCVPVAMGLQGIIDGIGRLVRRRFRRQGAPESRSATLAVVGKPQRGSRIVISQDPY